MFFASDNTSGVPEQVLKALGSVNAGYALGYGADTTMDRVRALVRETFEAPEAAVYLVATGTAANSLAIATHVQPWDAVYCHRHAHIEEDECNAPVFFTGGAKLALLDGPDAKIDPASFHAALNDGMEGVHHAQRGMLSITNLTERGSRYSCAEIAELATMAKDAGLPVHLDGARFANAVMAEGCSPAEMTWKAGVDVLSFGGTKNGLLGVEGVILFDPRKAWEFELRRKRGGHLFSKHRYLSAQMEAYLTDGLWQTLATTANARAAALEAGLSGSAMRLLHPRGGNILFVAMPKALHQRLKAAGAVYYDMPNPDPDMVTARFVTSWSTTEDDVDTFLRHVAAG
ncbi:MAG: beta-eliminating lyase-related protein [Paracoccaceae bacterium]